MSTLFLLLTMLARHLAGLTLRTIVIDGIKWSYLEGGSPHGPPLLLVHGFGAEKEHWLQFASILAKRGYRVICPDLPGFGESDKHPTSHTSYEISAQAERVKDFIQALEMSPVHYVGNSMGGYIGLQLAIDHPGVLKSLSLFNAAGTQGEHPSELNHMIDRGENPLVVDTLEDYDNLLSMVAKKPLPVPLPFKKVLLERAKKNARLHDEIFWEISRTATETPLNDQLHKVDVPTLILWGRHDRLIDVSCVDVLDAEIPDSRAIIYEDIGHVPMMECPKRSARDQLAFLAELR